jgi:hypothetical protein
MGNQNQSIEEEQKTQWPKEKGQNIHIKLPIKQQRCSPGYMGRLMIY